MLDANLKQQLNTYLQNIVAPIELSVSSNDSPKSRELSDLAQEIAELNEKITLRQVEGARAPSLAVGPAGQTPRVNFAGIPMGHEFTSLVLALLQAG
ncbi:MAG: alkyl hydroperoxide reductase subunit F, partial [Marinobacterium sp.]